MHLSRRLLPVLSLCLFCVTGPALAASVTVLQSDDPYAVVFDSQRTAYKGTHLSDANEVEALQKRFPGKFIWFRQSDKTYMVRDPATLAKVEAAWAAGYKVAEDMTKLSEQMDAQRNARAGASRPATAATRPNKADAGETSAPGMSREAASKQMDALFKQAQYEDKVADARTRTLVRAAQNSGLAQEVPASALTRTR